MGRAEKIERAVAIEQSLEAFWGIDNIGRESEKNE